ncbi:MAG: alpha/beta hydrolase [Gemmatimonadota bacterium]
MTNATTGTRRLAIRGASLETRWIGPPPNEAPSIVMLHEGLGSLGLWGQFPEALAGATGCGVFAWSRAGYGGSDPASLPRPLTYMHDEALQALPLLLDTIGFRHGILLGHSDGASIATIYAGGVQDHRIRGLALIAPHFFVEDVSIASIERARVAYEKADLRDRLAKHHANVDVAFRGWNDTWLNPGFRSWDIRESIGYIRVPILIVQGTEDQYGTDAQIQAARDEAYCPVDAVMISGAGHAAHLERPAETLAAVAEFVNTLLAVDQKAKPVQQ